MAGGPGRGTADGARTNGESGVRVRCGAPSELRMKILILGGTEEARQLADQLVLMGHEVITSFAGSTSEPKLPQGEIRSGGFGGQACLASVVEPDHD